MTHLKESSTILWFTRYRGLASALETAQSIACLNANQIRTTETESPYWKQLGCSDVSFIENFDGSETIWIAADSSIDATGWVLKTALTCVLRIRGTGPEDLLGTVTIVPEAILSEVEL